MMFRYTLYQDLLCERKRHERTADEYESYGKKDEEKLEREVAEAYANAAEMVKNADDKQVPLTPKFIRTDDGIVTINCPVCGKYIKDADADWETDPNYCSYCGQRLRL